MIGDVETKAMTLEQFLAFSSSPEQEDKRWAYDGSHAFIEGEMASGYHELMIANFMRWAIGALGDQPVEPLPSNYDLVTPNRRVFKPDAGLEYGRIEPGSTVWQLPRVLLEVLSDSNSRTRKEFKDFEDKIRDYQRDPRVWYILIPTVKGLYELDLCFRNDLGQWEEAPIEGLDAVIDLPRLGLSLPMRALYRNIRY